MTVRAGSGLRKWTLKWNFGYGSNVLVDNRDPIADGR